MTREERQAVQDIKNELQQENSSKCFISKSFIEYRPYLNPVMDTLVNKYLEDQKRITEEKLLHERHRRRSYVASCFLTKTGEYKLIRYGIHPY